MWEQEETYSRYTSKQSVSISLRLSTLWNHTKLGTNTNLFRSSNLSCMIWLLENAPFWNKWRNHHNVRTIFAQKEMQHVNVLRAHRCSIQRLQWIAGMSACKRAHNHVSLYISVRTILSLWSSISSRTAWYLESRTLGDDIWAGIECDRCQYI